MPAYISHAVMGNNLYQEISGFTKVMIDPKIMQSHSLGADLAFFSKSPYCDPHNKKTQAFFINLVNYIKEYDLKEDPLALSILYGHIAHYFLDINIHPLIYYVEKSCKKVGIINPHNLIEGYIDEYLVRRVLNKDIMEINEHYFEKLKLDDLQCINMLNSVYGKTYHDYHIIKSYREVSFWFLTIERLIKNSLIITKEFLIKFVKFREFMNLNHLNYNDFHNESHEFYTNPVSGEKHCESIMELYNKSIDMAVDAIKKVNKYIYDNFSIDSLTTTFKDLSYDTGVSCSIGKKFVYVKKINK